MYRDKSISHWTETSTANDYAHEHIHDDLLPYLDSIEAALEAAERGGVQLADALAALDHVRQALGLDRPTITERIRRLKVQLVLLKHPGNYYDPARGWVPCQVDAEQISRLERELARLRGEKAEVAA